MVRIGAVDLGASSGRVYVGNVSPSACTLREVARFPNGARERDGHLYWDFSGLMEGVLDGLTSANAHGPLASIGVDSWAVDYGRLDAAGALLDDPFCYRDARTAVAVEDFASRGALEDLFTRTGVAHQPFNTVFQLWSDARAGLLRNTEHLALIPDLINYLLSGELATEFTNASTTQLLGLDGEWDDASWNQTGAPASLFGPLVQPGNVLGSLSDPLRQRLGASQTVDVINVASHDTASAVLGVPAQSDHFAYISCGTWSLIGAELDHPVVSTSARVMGYSNERGVEGTYRFLHNVMGLWVLQECMRTWAGEGEHHDVGELVAASALEPALARVIDINDPSLLAPGDMPRRLRELCAHAGQPLPESAPAFTRLIIDSLVLAYRDALRHLETLTEHPIDEIHIVGGGVHNTLLCQLTADACERDVVAGPVEAAALGNVLVQARSLGVLGGDRWALREFIRHHETLVRYSPRPAFASRYANFEATRTGSTG